jgi:hypothetical protein
MKTLMIISLLTVATLSNAQSEPLQVSYVTPNRDTIFITKDMYPSIVSIWEKPEYVKDKPIIIPVDSTMVIASIIKARREDEN